MGQKSSILNDSHLTGYLRNIRMFSIALTRIQAMTLSHMYEIYIYIRYDRQISGSSYPYAMSIYPLNDDTDDSFKDYGLYSLTDIMANNIHHPSTPLHRDAYSYIPPYSLLNLSSPLLCTPPYFFIENECSDKQKYGEFYTTPLEIGLTTTDLISEYKFSITLWTMYYILDTTTGGLFELDGVINLAVNQTAWGFDLRSGLRVGSVTFSQGATHIGQWLFITLIIDYTQSYFIVVILILYIYIYIEWIPKSYDISRYQH